MAEQVLFELFDGLTIWLTDTVPAFAADLGDFAVLKDGADIVAIYQSAGGTTWRLYLPTPTVETFDAITAGGARAPVLVVSPGLDPGDDVTIPVPLRNPAVLNDYYNVSAVWAISATPGTAGDVEVYRNVSLISAPLTLGAGDGDIVRSTDIVLTGSVTPIFDQIRFVRPAAGAAGSAQAFVLLF